MSAVTNNDSRYAESDSISRVTDTAIRYAHVFVCLGCDRLALSSRSDAVTCSAACRIRVHREKDKLQAWYDLLAAMRVSVAMVQQAKAVKRLRPDLVDALRLGTLELEDTRRDMHVAMMKLIFPSESNS